MNSSSRYDIDDSKPFRKGGHGTLYFAYDREMHRTVLVKLLNDDIATLGQYRNRFLREVFVASVLGQTAGVTIHGFFEHDDGTPGYVMDLVLDESLGDETPARTLEEVLGTIPIRGNRSNRQLISLLDMLIDICNIAQYAHKRKGVIHRDIKCENIMVSESRVVLLDWGVAKVPDSIVPESVRTQEETQDFVPEMLKARPGETLPNEGIGTTGYIAPEQLADPASVDPRADVYSLGVVLYRILVGETPESPADDEGHDPRKKNPNVDRELAAICKLATARSRDKRYASVAALAKDLIAWRSDQPVSALRNTIGNLWRIGRQYQTLVAVVLALVLFGSPVAFFYAINTSRQKLQVENLNHQLEEQNNALEESLETQRNLASASDLQLQRLVRRDYAISLLEAVDMVNSFDPKAAIAILDSAPTKLKDFSFALLKERAMLAHQLVKTAEIRPQQLSFVDGPENPKLLVASSDGSIAEWQLAPFQKSKVLHEGMKSISWLNVSVLERTRGEILVGDLGGTVAQLHQNGKLIRSFRAHNAAIKLACVTSDNEFVTCAENGEVAVWDAESGKQLSRYAFDGPIRRSTYSDESRLIAAGRPNGELQIISIDDGEPFQPKGHPKSWVGDLAFIERGRTLIECDRSGSVRLWDVETSRVKSRSRPFSNPIRHIAASGGIPPAKIAMASREEGVHVAKDSAAPVLNMLPLSARRVRYRTNSLAITLDGRWLAFGHADSRLSLWDLSPLSPTATIVSDESVTQLVTLGEKNPVIVHSGIRGACRIWDTEYQQQRVLTDRPTTSKVVALAKSPTTSKIGYVLEDGTIQVRDVSSAKLDAEGVSEKTEDVRGAWFSHDGKELITSRLKSLEVQNSESLEVIRSLSPSDIDMPEFRQTAVSPTDSRVVVFGRYRLALLDYRHEQVVWNVALENPRLFLTELLFSPDGSRVFSINRNGEIIVWNANTGQKIALHRDQAGRVTDLVISPDGKTLAVANNSGRIELLDAEEGHKRLTLQADSSPVNRIVFSDCGSMLIAGHAGGVDIWAVASLRDNSNREIRDASK